MTGNLYFLFNSTELDMLERDTHQAVQSEVVAGRIGNQVGELDMRRRDLASYRLKN